MFGATIYVFGAIEPLSSMRGWRQYSSLRENEWLPYSLVTQSRWAQLEKLTQDQLVEEQRQAITLEAQIELERKKLRLLGPLMKIAIENRDVATAQRAFGFLNQLKYFGSINGDNSFSINNSLSMVKEYSGLSVWIENKVFYDSYLMKRYSLLHSAVLNGDTEFAKFLFALGADPQLCLSNWEYGQGMVLEVDNGPSAFDLAKSIAAKTGDQGMVELLMQFLQKKAQEEESKQDA